jgi:hypothetical protein
MTPPAAARLGDFSFPETSPARTDTLRRWLSRRRIRRLAPAFSTFAMDGCGRPGRRLRAVDTVFFTGTSSPALLLDGVHCPRRRTGNGAILDRETSECATWLLRLPRRFRGSASRGSEPTIALGDVGPISDWPLYQLCDQLIRQHDGGRRLGPSAFAAGVARGLVGARLEADADGHSGRREGTGVRRMRLVADSAHRRSRRLLLMAARI